MTALYLQGFKNVTGKKQTNHHLGIVFSQWIQAYNNVANTLALEASIAHTKKYSFIS
jgi:hypothetical protein